MDITELLRLLGLRQAYDVYQRNVGQPVANVAGPFGRGLLGLQQPEYGSEEAYRTGQAVGNMPGTGAPAGLLKAAPEVISALGGIAALGAKASNPMTDVKQAVQMIYHGTSPKSAKAIEKSGFDLSKSADGSVWFTSNPNIGEVAATGKGAVVTRMLDEKKLKLGGWDEADKFSMDELLQKGYDGLKLTDPTGSTIYQIFNPEKLSIK